MMMILILLPGNILKVWASQFPFQSCKDNIPPNEACLYDHINWILAQTQQQPSSSLLHVYGSYTDSKNKGSYEGWLS